MKSDIKSLVFLICLALPSSFLRADDTEIFFPKPTPTPTVMPVPAPTPTLCANVSSSSFSTPIGVGSTTKDAQSLEYVYQNVFAPQTTLKWSGNLKKYRYDATFAWTDSNGNAKKGAVIDSNVSPLKVFDEKGNVNNGTKSFWSTSADKVALETGKQYIEKGGAGGVVTSPRTIYSTYDHDGNSATQDLMDTVTNVGLVTYLSDPNPIGTFIDSVNLNSWIVGDPIHSEPSVINYGNRNKTYSSDSPDIRIALGTNRGFMHFFADDLNTATNYTDDTVAESWSFVSRELLLDETVDPPIINAEIESVWNDDDLSANNRGYYGIDGVIAVYKDDKNQDGNICTKALDCDGDGFQDGDINHDGDTLDENEGDDRVVIVFGMRRGGSYYYALDVTNPDTPTFLWKFSDAEMIQSWATAQFGKVQYYDKSNIIKKTAVILTAGYDTNKDTTSTNDSKGRGLYILDIDTGQIIWSVLNGTGISTETTFYTTALVDSIPAPPKVIDVDGDGFLDRIYLADTGGNIWRADMYNADLVSLYGGNNVYKNNVDSREFWSFFQLGKLGRHDDSIDRRFFNQIDFVQTRDSNSSFDALLLGSGQRNHPYEVTVTNRFYMLKDSKVGTYKVHNSKCDAQDVNCINYSSITGYPLVNSNLSDITSSALTSFSSKGWRLDLLSKGPNGQGGEKNLSSSLTIKGNVAFTTYRPPDTSDLCVDTTTDADQYKFYVINLHLGSAQFDLNSDGSVTSGDRSKSINHTGIPQKPFIITPDGKKLYILPSLGEDPIHDDSTELKTQTHFWFKKD